MSQSLPQIEVQEGAEVEAAELEDLDEHSVLEGRPVMREHVRNNLRGGKNEGALDGFVP